MSRNFDMVSGLFYLEVVTREEKRAWILGISTLLPAMAEAPHFRIADAVYPCFTLSAILGSIARIFAYRRGFQPW